VCVCVWGGGAGGRGREINNNYYIYFSFRVFSDDPLDLPVRYSREVNERELEESFSKNAGPPLTVWISKCAHLTTFTNYNFT
jgi:hypothetical protein